MLPQYKDFAKGDARRYFVTLLAVDILKDHATLNYIAKEIGCTRSEAQRALNVLVAQFGVTFERHDSAYKITSWGVLKKAILADFVKSVN